MTTTYLPDYPADALDDAVPRAVTVAHAPVDRVFRSVTRAGGTFVLVIMGLVGMFLTIKALITFARRPLFCFFSVAAAALLISALFTALSVLFMGDSVVVFMSIAVLGGSLALFLGFAGAIGSLVSQYGADHLAPLQVTTGDDRR